MLSGPGFHIGLQDIDPVHIIVKCVYEFLGESAGILSKFVRSLNNLVIHVREVTHIGNIEPFCPEISYQDIEYDG